MNERVSTRVKLGDVPLVEMADEELMSRYIAGDQECIRLLVHRYERELFSYLRRLLGDGILAEDVFQNTFLQVYLKKDLFDSSRLFRPWLYTIATHQAIDAMRRNQRHQRASLHSELDQKRSGSGGTLLDLIPDEGVEPEGLAQQSERRHFIRGTVDALPETLRLVVVLAYYQGLKYKDIADMLDIPVGTVKSRLHTAIKKLGDDWNKLGFLKD